MNSEIQTILKEIQTKIDFRATVTITPWNYKKKVASVNLDTNEIKINKEILKDKANLREVLHHELLHLKLGERRHGPEFFD